MKQFWCLSALLISLVTAQSVQAIGRLSVELRPISKEVQTQLGVSDGVVEFELKNTGDEAIEVDKDRIPVTMKDGKLMSAAFVVTGPDGVEVAYLGAFVEYIDDSLRTEIIQPGKKIVERVHLAKSYQITAGKVYTVSMRNPVRYLDRPREHMPKASASDLRSLLKSEEITPIKITIGVEAVTEANRDDLSSLAAAEVECTADQNTKFDEAKTKAIQMAVEASSFMTAQFSQVVENSVVYEKFANPPRFVTWFGRHPDKYVATDGPGPVDKTLRTAINMNGPRIHNMTLSCTCDDPKIDKTKSPAYVYATIPYVMHACPLFWASPLIPTARDENSKVGTIIHEAVHFVDQFWGGSGPGPDGSGHYTGPTYQETLNLAVANRANAAKNPNNFRFYTLNQSW